MVTHSIIQCIELAHAENSTISIGNSMKTDISTIGKANKTLLFSLFFERDSYEDQKFNAHS